jgi:hypothetical protein
VGRSSATKDGRPTMKFWLLLGLLFVLPSSLRAQASQNCSTIGYTIPHTSVSAHDCSNPLVGPTGTAYTATWSFHTVCTNRNTNTAYQTTDFNLTDTGHCMVTITGQITDCPPSFVTTTTVPPNSPSQNKILFEGFDQNVSMVGSGCSEVKGQTDTVTCPTVGCACAPGPHTCPANYLWNTSTCSCVKVSPIVLDISGKGFSLTDAKNGVLFDPGIGRQVQMAWTAQGSDNAFLALPGKDGVVNNGKELFGNLTQQPASNDPNGFAALAVYDDPKNGGNGDGVIDAKDAIFSSLRLWIDANHDGISQKNEMHTLPSLGVNSLSLKYKETPKTDQYGNEFRFKGHVNPDDPHGQVDRVAYDVFFVSVPESPTATAKCAVPSVVPGIEEKKGMLSKR